MVEEEELIEEATWNNGKLDGTDIILGGGDLASCGTSCSLKRAGGF